MSDIRGLIIQSRLDYIENQENGAKYQEVFQKLSESVRQAIGEQVFLTNLYSFHLLKEIDAVLGEVTKMPLESLFIEIGQQSTPLMLDRYFYNYMQNKDPHGFLAQIARLYPHLCHFGKYTFAKTGETKAEITFDYDEDIHKPYCWFIQAILRHGIELCGGKSVVLKEKQCEAEDDECCQYQISWKS
jgi:uncharacterized protein (TIGR02265 family)